MMMTLIYHRSRLRPVRGPPPRRAVAFQALVFRLSLARLGHTTPAPRGSQADRGHARPGAASARRTVGGLIGAARSITFHASATVGMPLASRTTPRNALQVPSPSKRTLHRGEGKGSAARLESDESNMGFV